MAEWLSVGIKDMAWMMWLSRRTWLLDYIFVIWLSILLVFGFHGWFVMYADILGILVIILVLT